MGHEDENNRIVIKMKNKGMTLKFHGEVITGAHNNRHQHEPPPLETSNVSGLEKMVTKPGEGINSVMYGSGERAIEV